MGGAAFYADLFPRNFRSNGLAIKGSAGGLSGHKLEPGQSSRGLHVG